MALACGQGSKLKFSIFNAIKLETHESGACVSWSDCSQMQGPNICTQWGCMEGRVRRGNTDKDDGRRRKNYEHLGLCKENV